MVSERSLFELNALFSFQIPDFKWELEASMQTLPSAGGLQSISLYITQQYEVLSCLRIADSLPVVDV